MSVFFIFIYLLIITFISIGYGYIFVKIINPNINILSFNIGELGFIGFYGLLIISILIHFFLPLSFVITFIVALVGIFLFLLYFNKSKINLNIYQILFFFYVTIISFNTNSHPDFEWYHLPYMNYLKDFKIIFGIANVNDFLGYTQTWNDILSILRLPIFDFYTSNVVSSTFLLLFFICILDFIRKESKTSIKIFLTLILIFSIIKYHKINEFAGHAPATVLGFILLYYVLKLILDGDTKINKDNNLLIFKIIFLFSFILILRINYIFLIPVIIYLFYYQYNVLYKFLKSYRIVIFFILISVIILSKNIIVSGCFFYPIYWTCLSTDYLSWGISIDYAKERYDLVTALTKGWSSYVTIEGKIDDRIFYLKPLVDGIILNPSEYLNNFKFTWVKYWLNTGDPHKLSNNILIILFCFVLIISTQIKKLNFTISNFPKKIIIIFLLNAFIWFFLTPQSIYGGDLVSITFFSLIVSILLNNINLKSFYTKSILFLLFTVSISYSFYKNYGNYENYIENFSLVSNGLITVENNKEKFDFYSKKLNGYNLNIKNKSQNDHPGHPDYCGNIPMICIPIDRLKCVSNITRKYTYLIIQGNNYECKKILKKRYFY